MKESQYSNSIYLLLVAFFEGGAVMAIELISARLLTPFFGMSLYVWASVLSVTLLSLTIGYYLGGMISKRVSFYDYMKKVFLCIGVYALLMPFISKFILNILIELPLEIGIILSSILILCLPLILLGSTTPMIINYLTQNQKTSGLNTGNVFSISTLGGITFVFLFGHYLLPNFGVTISSVISSVFLFTSFALLMLNQRAIN